MNHWFRSFTCITIMLNMGIRYGLWYMECFVNLCKLVTRLTYLWLVHRKEGADSVRFLWEWHFWRICLKCQLQVKALVWDCLMIAYFWDYDLCLNLDLLMLKNVCCHELFCWYLWYLKFVVSLTVFLRSHGLNTKQLLTFCK